MARRRRREPDDYDEYDDDWDDEDDFDDSDLLEDDVPRRRPQRRRAGSRAGSGSRSRSRSASRSSEPRRAPRRRPPARGRKPAARRGKRKQSNAWIGWAIGGGIAGVAVLVGMIFAVMHFMNDDDTGGTDGQTASSSSDPSTNNGGNSDPAGNVPGDVPGNVPGNVPGDIPGNVPGNAGGGGNSGGNGPPWVVLSNFRIQREGISSEISVDYRVVSGRASGSYVLRVQRQSGALVEYVDFDVSLQQRGTVTGAVGLGGFITSSGVKAVMGRKKFGGPGGDDLDPISGELGVGQSQSVAQRPLSPAESAGAAAQGKLFALANPKSGVGLGGRGFSVDYQIQGSTVAGSYVWVIKDGSGEEIRMDVSSEFRFSTGEKSGTLAGRPIGVGAVGMRPPYQMWIESSNGPAMRFRSSKGKVVSNVVTSR